MLDKLALLLKSKIALAAIGATLVAGGGASVAAAATGAQVPVVSQALHAATGTHDANDDHGQDAAGHDANDDKGHDGAAKGTPGADNDANDDHGQDANDANEHEAQGTVSSVDAAGSSFVLKESTGASVTIKVSTSTVFDGGLTKLGDLKAGMTIEVKGATQADGTVAASRVHGEDVNEDQGDDHGGSGSGSSGSSGGSSSGSSGGSDDHGGNG